MFITLLYLYFCKLIIIHGELALTKIMYQKMDERKLVLVESKRLTDISCGKCGESLWAFVYYTPDGHFVKKIYCKKCKIEIWMK